MLSKVRNRIASTVFFFAPTSYILESELKVRAQKIEKRLKSMIPAQIITKADKPNVWFIERKQRSNILRRGAFAESKKSVELSPKKRVFRVR
jgi:hypothetical protein